MVQYYVIMVFSLGLTLDRTMNYQALAWAELGPPTMCLGVCGGGLSYTFYILQELNIFSTVHYY